MADVLTGSAGSTDKVCFVTTGATAPFTALIESVLQSSSLNALIEDGYTHLLIQYGTAKDVFEARANVARQQLLRDHGKQALMIGGFDFDQDGLRKHLTLVQTSNGLVISHAGSGTILAALRYNIPLIVVPNTNLLDNHQEELAVAMERSKYLLRGDVKHLVPSIQQSVEFRRRMAQFPPMTSGDHRETKSFDSIMDETMGFFD